MKKTRTIKNSQGFTLIELMITVAIVGILTAVALPAYQDYTIRSQVSEGLSLVSGAKPIVGEYFANHGDYPTNEKVGFNGYIGKYITKTEIGANGKIVATFGNQANSKIAGQTVTLAPEADTNTGNIKWTCGSSANAKYLPTSCANDGSTGNPGNPGNPDGGENIPTIDFDNFEGDYMGGSWNYKNGVFTSNGSIIQETSRDKNGRTYGTEEANGVKYHIDNDGVLSFVGSSGNTNSGYVFFPNDMSNMLTISSFKLNGQNGSTIEKLYTPSKNMSPPNYIISSPEALNLYNQYTSYASTLNNLAQSGGTYTNAQKQDFDLAKNNLQNYLKNYKESGGTLDPAFEYFLNI